MGISLFMDSSSLRQLLRSVSKMERRQKALNAIFHILCWWHYGVYGVDQHGYKQPIARWNAGGVGALCTPMWRYPICSPRRCLLLYGGLVVAFTINGLVYTGGLNNTGLYFIFPLLFIQIVVVRFSPPWFT